MSLNLLVFEDKIINLKRVELIEVDFNEKKKEFLIKLYSDNHCTERTLGVFEVFDRIKKDQREKYINKLKGFILSYFWHPGEYVDEDCEKDRVVHFDRIRERFYECVEMRILGGDLEGEEKEKEMSKEEKKLLPIKEIEKSFDQTSLNIAWEFASTVHDKEEDIRTLSDYLIKRTKRTFVSELNAVLEDFFDEHKIEREIEDILEEFEEKEKESGTSK